MCRASIKKNERAPTFLCFVATTNLGNQFEFVVDLFCEPGTASIVRGHCVWFCCHLFAFDCICDPFFFHVDLAKQEGTHQKQQTMHQVWRVSIHNNILNGRRTLDLVFCLRAHPFHQERLTSPSFDSTPASSYCIPGVVKCCFCCGTVVCCLLFHICHHICHSLTLISHSHLMIPHPTSSSCFGHCCRLRRLWVLKSCPSFCK